MTESPRIRDFLNAYARIERHLRTLTSSGPDRGFASVIEKASGKDRIVSRNQSELRAFHDLRNVIVHERLDDRRLAEPVPEVVDQIQTIARILTDAPRVDQLFAVDVTCCSPRDSIGEVSALMREEDFSSVPVVTEEGVEALLTAETIARFVGASAEIGLVDLETCVGDVLEETEDERHLQFLAREATTDAALGVFDDALRDGYSIDAILITHSGAPTQKPLGIITPFDVPRLLGD